MADSLKKDNMDLDDILAEFSGNPVVPAMQSDAEPAVSAPVKSAEPKQEAVNPTAHDPAPEQSSAHNKDSIPEKVPKKSNQNDTADESDHKQSHSERHDLSAGKESQPHADKPKGKKHKSDYAAGKSPDNKNKQDKLIYVILAVTVLLIILAAVLALLMTSDSPTEEPAQTIAAEIIPSPEVSTASVPEEDTTDAHFLSDLEQSVTAILSSDEANLREAVHANLETDLELLSPYAEAEYEDETIGTVAQNYIAALSKEAESFDAVYEESDLLWYEGYVLQMQMLTRLNSGYGFMSGNSAFNAKFISPLSETSSFYNKYSIISKDIRGQFDAITYLDYVNDYRYKTTLKNRTNYTFDITFYFDNYNETLPEDEEEAALIEPASSAEDALTNITPLKNYVVTDRVTSGVARMKTFVCHWTITSIE